MTKKELKKLIKEDIDKSYSFAYDEKQVMENFVVKEQPTYVYPINKKRLILKYAIVCIVGLLIGFGIGFSMTDFGLHTGITEDFEKFVQNEGHAISDNELLYNIKYFDRCNIHIYKINAKTGFNYYYITKVETKKVKAYLVLEDKKIELTHNSYGLLDSIEDNENRPLKFYIEVNGEIQEYIFNQ